MRRWILAGLIALGLFGWSAKAPAQVRAGIAVGPRGGVVAGRTVGGPFGVPRRGVHRSPRGPVYVHRGPVVGPWWGGYTVHRGPVVGPWWGGPTVGRSFVVTPSGPFGVAAVHRPIVVMR
jgi:hypothetical protein